MLTRIGAAPWPEAVGPGVDPLGRGRRNVHSPNKRNPLRPEFVFVPMAVLALWTCVVLFYLGAKRVAAVRSRRLAPSDFRMGDSPAVPTELIVINRNLTNLLEMPVLFYVVCLSLYVTHLVVPGIVWLASVFTLLRMLHSLVQINTAWILRRLIVFASSNLVLLGLWIWFLARLL